MARPAFNLVTVDVHQTVPLLRREGHLLPGFLHSINAGGINTVPEDILPKRLHVHLHDVTYHMGLVHIGDMQGERLCVY